MTKREVETTVKGSISHMKSQKLLLLTSSHNSFCCGVPTRATFAQMPRGSDLHNRLF